MNSKLSQFLRSIVKVIKLHMWAVKMIKVALSIISEKFPKGTAVVMVVFLG